MMKRFFLSILASFLILTPLQVFALTQEQAFQKYKDELISLDLSASASEEKAKQDVEAMLESMEASQYDVEVAFNALEARVNALLRNDARREEAKSELENAEDAVKAFTLLEAQNHLEVQEALAGVLPQLLTTTTFEQAQREATDAMAEVNRVLINPSRPGNVPEGDLFSDFIPQLIRQLFRFAWLGVLVAFTVSGVFLIMAKENDDRISKAKTMIYYSLIGFVVIALAFAIVKGVTDIDFFNFI